MSSWQPFRGEYEKTFYQIRFPDGEVRKHCFPNAGYMHALDGSGLMWSEKSQIEFKRCDCGEKWSGCSEMETSLTPAEEESLRERSDLMHRPAEY